MPLPGREVAAEPGTEAGSFRDPDSRVFIRDGAVYRALSREGWEDWEALAATPLLPELIADGRLVATEPVEVDALPELTRGTAAGVLRHERIPFVSYPYEWPFSMLRDAALLQLELGRRALQADFTLKDASSYNVQWRGASPVFIDVGSFERLRLGEPWAGYRQFCMLFLYPLMLQAYKGLPYHAWLRGSLDGIAPSDARAVMSARDRLRRGVLTHVVLHARLQARHGDSGGRQVKSEMKRAGFGKELLDANLRRLEKLVRRLEFKPGRTAWTEYGETNTYTDADAESKAAFVRTAAARRPGALVWDIGCNDGTYSRVAAESAGSVVALDADHATVDGLYRALREEGRQDILPLVMSITDPSPDLGWRGRERSSLEQRGTPDLALCLAVVHHVAITGNVPVREFLSWLRSLDCALVIEFPERDDPMVQRLLAGKPEAANPDYDRETFERALGETFEVERSERLASGTRTLYEARPRA
jgi:2-polyprenyl-3-methyl-5-hydroxy-6-metoxy-1,4-benzoquinol methylase